jgi:hypothetical protein
MNNEIIKYVITSSFTKYNESREHLINSLICNNIGYENIFIIYSRSPETCVKPAENKTNITEIYLESNLYEYSFFIGAALMLDAQLITDKTKLCMLHDTCIAGSKFASRTKRANIKYSQYDIIYGNSWGQHNIGIYNYKSILTGFQKFNHQEIITKGAAVAFEREGYLEYSPKSWSNLKQFFPRYDSMHMGLSDPYEDNKLRERNYMYFFDLHKYFYWGGHDGAGV